MKVVVTGGSGFIGRHLTESLLSQGHAVTVLTRSPKPRLPGGAAAVVWPGEKTNEPGHSRPGHGPEAVNSIPADVPGWRRVLEGADAVVNLAGEPIAAKRWNASQKERILHSRVRSTRALIDALGEVRQKPRVLISGSAVGYYGPRGDEEVIESDGPGRDFLSGVCTAWEESALRAEKLGIRVVLLRTGLVLGADGGALPRLLFPFRIFAGGRLGSGRQWMPWIHMEDMVGIINFTISNDKARGPVNAAGPNPETNYHFSRIIGRVIRRPSRLPVPGPALRLLLGEMAGPLLLSGQRALPARALDLGYRFRHRELEPALRSILQGPS